MADYLAIQDGYIVREGWRSSMNRLIISLAGGRVRLLTLTIGLLLILWQLFFFAWRPLRAETTLPEGLTGVEAKIDLAALETIRAERATRLQYASTFTGGADQYFATSPVAGAPAAP